MLQRILLLVVLFTINSQAQTEEPSWFEELPWVEISAAAHSIISGYVIHYQMEDRKYYGRGDPIYRDKQKMWRLLLPMEYLSAVGIGISIQLKNNNKPWYYYIVDIAEAGMIRVNVRQWTYQMKGGRHWLNQPNSDWTFFPGLEKTAGAWVKIGALAGIVIFKYIILPWIEGEL